MRDNGEIEFADNALAIVKEWLESDDGSVGCCFLCGSRIWSPDELIDGKHLCQFN
jgi:hypothetical protein